MPYGSLIGWQRPGRKLPKSLGWASVPVLGAALAIALWPVVVSATSCGFLPVSQLFGFAPLKVTFVANQFLPPGSVVWLVDGSPVTWNLGNGSTGTEIPTHPTGCFGSCNTIPRVTYTFENPGYHRVAMECKSAGGTYMGNEQAVLVMPPVPVTAVLLAGSAVLLSVLRAAARTRGRLSLPAQQPVAAPVPQANAAIEGSTRRRGANFRSRTLFRFRRPAGPDVSAPDSPERLFPDSPPSPIALEGGQPIPGLGTVQVGSRPPGQVRDLRLTTAGKDIVLKWDSPDFDSGRDKLLGYQIFRMEFTGRSSAPEEVLVGATPGLGWQEPYVQTSRHSTWQDVVAYVVKPYFQSLAGQTQGLQYAGPGSTALVPHV